MESYVTLLDEQPRTTLGGTEADALIKEARRLQRRRWLSISIAMILVAGAVGVAVYTGSPTRKPPAARRAQHRLPSPSIAARHRSQLSYLSASST